VSVGRRVNLSSTHVGEDLNKTKTFTATRNWMRYAMRFESNRYKKIIF
jgi:hypothetical protein